MGEDALQEAYYRACLYWKSYDFNRDFNNWIYGLLQNAIKNTINEEKRHGINYKDPTISEAFLLPSKIGNPQKTRELTEVLNRIRQEPENRAYILQLALVDQFSHGEIAQIVSENQNTITNMVYRFRKENREDFR